MLIWMLRKELRQTHMAEHGQQLGKVGQCDLLHGSGTKDAVVYKAAGAKRHTQRNWPQKSRVKMGRKNLVHEVGTAPQLQLLTKEDQAAETYKKIYWLQGGLESCALQEPGP
jgi:hypothetical protein